MAYLNDLLNSGGVSYFINDEKGIFYFPNATISAANNLITIQANGLDNSFRFIDMPEEDRLGTSNAIELLIEWTKRGYFGASGASESSNNTTLGSGTTSTPYETAMIGLIESMSSKIDLITELLKSIAR